MPIYARVIIKLEKAGFGMFSGHLFCGTVSCRSGIHISIL